MPRSAISSGLYKNMYLTTICWSRTLVGLQCLSLKFSTFPVVDDVCYGEGNLERHASVCVVALEVTTSNSFGRCERFKAKISNYFRLPKCVFTWRRAPTHTNNAPSARTLAYCTLRATARFNTVLRPRLDRCTVWLCATRRYE